MQNLDAGPIVGLNDQEKKYLLSLVRTTIVSILENDKLPETEPISDKMYSKFGVFVTLHKEGNLRGCIGFSQSNFPLVQATIEAAISAATADPRFPRVKKEEMKSITIDVSVLTTPTLMEVDDPRDYLKKIKIGRDGLIVERNYNIGLLLPQVPVDLEWDVEDFLANSCMKAGLTPDAWLIKGTKIYKFSCIIMRENHPNGAVQCIDMAKISN